MFRRLLARLGVGKRSRQSQGTGPSHSDDDGRTGDAHTDGTDGRSVEDHPDGNDGRPEDEQPDDTDGRTDTDHPDDDDRDESNAGFIPSRLDASVLFAHGMDTTAGSELADLEEHGETLEEYQRDIDRGG